MYCTDKELIFHRFFGSNRSNKEFILNENERSLARLVYSVAIDEIQPSMSNSDDYDSDDTDSNISFDEKIEAAAKNFERVVRLFDLSNEAKNAFLKNFEGWSTLRESNVKRLKDIAEKMQTDKFNSDISKVVGGVVGAVGGVLVGLSLFTPLAAVTLPLTISGGVLNVLGGGVVVGTTATEIALLKNKLEEAKILVMQEKASFSTMAPWFIHSKETKEAIESLVSYNLLREMSEDLKIFLKEVKDVKNFTEGENNYGRLKNNLLVMNMMGIGVEVGQIVAKMAVKSSVAAGNAAVARIAVTGMFVAAGIAIDVLNVVMSSIDLHNRPEVQVAKNIKNAAEDLNKEFLFIKRVYDELKIGDALTELK